MTNKYEVWNDFGIIHKLLTRKTFCWQTFCFLCKKIALQISYKKELLLGREIFDIICDENEFEDLTEDILKDSQFLLYKYFLFIFVVYFFIS